MNVKDKSALLTSLTKGKPLKELIEKSAHSEVKIMNYLTKLRDTLNEVIPKATIEDLAGEQPATVSNKPFIPATDMIENVVSQLVSKGAREKRIRPIVEQAADMYGDIQFSENGLLEASMQLMTKPTSHFINKTAGGEGGVTVMTFDASNDDDFYKPRVMPTRPETDREKTGITPMPKRKV